MTYERNAWGNDTKDAVQAADVNQLLGGETSAPPTSSTPEVPTTIVEAASASAPDPATTVDPASLQPLTHEELMAEGEKVYAGTCAACHQLTGAGLPGAFPSLIASPIVTGPVADHINLVLHGKAGTAMAAFGTQLSWQQLAAVITYERNAWGNDTGDTVQPADIANFGQ